MRILQLTPFWRPVAGGISSFVSGLTSQLIATGHEVSVASMQGAPEADVTIIGQSRIRGFHRATTLMSALRPDAIHVHGHWFLLLPALWARLRGRTGKIIYTFHTAPDTTSIRSRILGTLLNRCNVVTAVSGNLLVQNATDLGIRAAQIVTRPGVSPPSGDAADGQRFRSILGVSDEDLLIVAVSVFQYPEKVAGILSLLRAFRDVVPDCPESKLVLVGDGQYRKDIEFARASLGLTSSVFLPGALPDVRPALRAADIFCHISFRDELPQSLIEAMAYGKPIVCNDVGGTPEVFRDDADGIMTDGSSGAIADSLRCLIRERPRRERYANGARERAAQALTWSRAVVPVLSSYGAEVRKMIHISVDVEEDYHLAQPSYRGVAEALPRLLDLFLELRVPASFFVTSDVLHRFPGLVQRIINEGHHLGSHGESHRAGGYAGKPRKQQIEELRRVRETIGSLASKPSSFRAPNFLIDSSTIAALAEVGFDIDSSILPGRVVRRTRNSPRIDFRGALWQPYLISPPGPSNTVLRAVTEVPVAANMLAPGSPLGLGYVNLAGPDAALNAIRLFPAPFLVLLVHPWEAIDYPSDARIPKWMKGGCMSDLGRLRKFLEAVIRDHDVVPWTALTYDVIRPNTLHDPKGNPLLLPGSHR